jgi:hypothetical protein
MNKDDQGFIGAGDRIGLIAEVVEFEPASKGIDLMRVTQPLLGQVPKSTASCRAIVRTTSSRSIQFVA